MKFPDAVMFRQIGYTEVSNQIAGVHGCDFVAMCRDNRLPILVFNLNTARQYNAYGVRRTGRHTDQLKENEDRTRIGPDKATHSIPSKMLYPTRSSAWKRL